MVEIKSAMWLHTGTELRVDVRTAQEVEFDFHLWNQLIPKMEGEVFVDAAQSHAEMILEGMDAALGSIAPVCAWGNQLKINVIVSHAVLEDLGTFIVEVLKLGF